MPQGIGFYDGISLSSFVKSQKHFLLRFLKTQIISKTPIDVCFTQTDGSRGTSVGEDSEFEDLVAEGREEHPIVRYTRLVRDKKAELEYVYNPVSAASGKKTCSDVVWHFF